MIREYLFGGNPYDGLDMTGHVYDTKPFNIPYSVLNTVKPQRDLWGRYTGLNLKNGFPTIYPDFIRNVVAAGHADRITPFPTTSLIAARVLGHLNLKADTVYLDGSHDYEDVMADLEAYWPLMSTRGVIIGDDFNEYWRVRDAVPEFAAKVGMPYEVHEDGGWLLHKTTVPKLLYG